VFCDGRLRVEEIGNFFVDDDDDDDDGRVDRRYLRVTKKIWKGRGRGRGMETGERKDAAMVDLEEMNEGRGEGVFVLVVVVVVVVGVDGRIKPGQRHSGICHMTRGLSASGSARST
jgi:hypothetical protein